VILFIPPHKLEPLMWPAFIGTMGTVFGIMAYAVSVNGGSAGNLVAPAIYISSSNRAFRFIQCISTVVGTYGGAADRFGDWTRFAKKKDSHVIGTIVGMPIVITLCSLLGVLTASATKAHYGTTYWQPLTYLQYVLKTKYTSGSRAALFFAGLAIFSHQVFVNATQNNITAGMDLAGGFPRYVSMKRGALILCTLGVLCQPWRFFTQATVFLSVIGSFGVVTGPTTAILIIDYYFLRKGNWKIPDIFNGGPQSIYWYWRGINFRSIVPYIIAILPSMRKLPLPNYFTPPFLKSETNAILHSGSGREYYGQDEQRSQNLPTELHRRLRYQRNTVPCRQQALPTAGNRYQRAV
jgi:NCS1 family nucleobase:cation symporter-1